MNGKYQVVTLSCQMWICKSVWFHLCAAPRKELHFSFIIYPPCFSWHDVKCDFFVYCYSESRVPASHHSPRKRRARCNWLFDQRSLSAMDCDGCHSERWGMEKKKITYTETASQLVVVQKVGKCHELRLGVAITSSSMAQNRGMNNVFTFTHTCPSHTHTHTHTHTRTNHVK